VNKNPSFSFAGQFARRSSQHGDMRRRNESTLLSLVRRYPGLSSADLARRSGIAPQTISVLLKGLEEQHIITRGDAMRGRRGQPAVPIRINPEGGYGIGVELGWRHVSIVLIDLCGKVLGRTRWEVPYQTGEGLIATIAAGVEEVAAVLPGARRRQIKGVGVAMPDRMPAYLHALEAAKAEDGGASIDMAGALRQHLQMPVVMLNDGTSACRAECAYGRGADYGQMLYVFIGTYIASGIFVDGRVIEGRSGKAVNLGYSVVKGADGAASTLHMIASVKALEDRLQAAGKPVARAAPFDWPWEVVGNEVVDWLDDAAFGLARAIINSCTVIDFSAVVLDGVLPQKMLDHLGRRTHVHLSKLAAGVFEPPIVIMGRVGPDAPAIGAANMPLYLTTFSPDMGAL